MSSRLFSRRASSPGSAATRASGYGSTSAGAAALLALLACGSRPAGYTAEEEPRQELGAFELVQSSGGDRSWRLEGRSGVYMESDSSGLIAGVRLTSYELDAPASLLTGDSGQIMQGGEAVRVWGDVRVETVDGRLLETWELTWIESLAVFTTDCVAVLTIPDTLGSTILTGRGITLGQDLGASSEVDVRESFTAIYSGEVPDIE